MTAATNNQNSTSQPAADKTKKALYILQMKHEKLTEESMKVLKCLLLHIVRTTRLEHIVIEVHFDEEQFSPLESHL